jgi:hypothetical protein
MMFLFGALVGLLLGLAIAYGKQALGLYKKRDTISAGLDLAESLGYKV